MNMSSENSTSSSSKDGSSSGSKYQNQNFKEDSKSIKPRSQKPAQLCPIFSQKHKMNLRSTQRVIDEDVHSHNWGYSNKPSPSNSTSFQSPDTAPFLDLGYDSKEQSYEYQPPSKIMPWNFLSSNLDKYEFEDEYDSSTSSETIKPDSSYGYPSPSTSCTIDKDQDMDENMISRPESRLSIRSTDSSDSFSSNSSTDSTSSTISLDGHIPYTFRVIDCLGIPDGLDHLSGQPRIRTVSPAMFTDWSPEMEEIMGFEAAKRDHQSCYEDRWKYGATNSMSEPSDDDEAVKNEYNDACRYK